MNGAYMQVHREFQLPEKYSKLFRDIGLLPADECTQLQARRSTAGIRTDPAKAKASKKGHVWQMPWYLAENLQLDTPALLQALSQGAASSHL